MNYILEGLMLISLGGLIVAFQNDLVLWPILLKAAASAFFVLAGIYGVCRKKGSRKVSGMMLGALLCSFVGDVLLALDKEEGILFVLGVVSFAAAHILFSLAFCSISGVRKMDVIAAVLVFAGLMPMLFVGNFDFQGLLPVLIGYAVIISFMMVKALSLWRCRQGRKRFVCLVMMGGVLFLASDILLLFWLFGIGVPKEVQSINWILYYLAQGCLSSSLNEEYISSERVTEYGNH